MTDYPKELRRIAADIRADLRPLHRDAALLDQAAAELDETMSDLMAVAEKRWTKGIIK